MSDLVERLRQWSFPHSDLGDVLKDAADEIERLRAALERIERQARTEMENDRNSAFEWIRQIAREALRDE